jgi:ABC-type polysaccharide/polyol phosphate export permease
VDNFKYTTNNFCPDTIETKTKYYLYINPLVGLVEFFRFSLIRGYHILSFYDFFISAMISIVVFILGLFIFKYKEDTFVDHL